MIYCRSGSPGIYTPDYVMDSPFCRKIRGLGRNLVDTKLNFNTRMYSKIWFLKKGYLV